MEFQFDLNTFNDEDGNSLIYRTEPEDRKFYWTAIDFESVKIRLIATDIA